MTPEQLTQVVRALKEAIQADRPDRGGTERLLAKHVRIENFSGDQSQWEDWSFAFKRSVRSMSRSTYDSMITWEKSKDEVNEEAELSKELEQRSSELYDILCQFCTGEALLVVKSVDDMEGIKAWQRLFRKYNPRTMARGVRMLSDVIGPPKMKDLSDFEVMVTKWEEQVKSLMAQFEEQLSEKMKIAIFTNMMPANLQDYIYVHTEKDCKYQDLREKVGVLVSNKVAATTGPVPMDIGDVGGRGDESWDENEYEEQYENEHEVGIVAGHYQCRNCHGYGHFARDCPSGSAPVGRAPGKGKGQGPKGGEKGKGKNHVKGKGAKGEGWNFPGKGNGKSQTNSYQQYFFKGKSKGKGYQGECWNCGKVGHKANECTAMDTNHVEQHEETIEVEGMWDVSNIQAECIKIDTKNRFEVLTENDGEENQEEQSLDHDGACNNRTLTTTTTHKQAATVSRDWESPLRRWQVRGKLQAKPEEIYTIGDIDAEHGESEKVFTRLSSMTFNVAGVCKPLASAAKVVEAGNRIIMDPEGSYVENVKTGERMQLRIKKGVFVFDVQYQDGDSGEITLDSGAGVSVWPKGLKQSLLRVGPRKEGLKMVAANGTTIENVGQTKVVFRGVAPQTACFSGQPC